MANVTGKVTNRFTYKGKTYEAGDEVSLDVKHAARYEGLNYVKFNREAEKKVEAAEEKKLTKQDGAVPKSTPKTK